MNSNLDKIALDLYGKIQTRFPNIKIGDENAVVLSKKEDIPRARFFEFEYEENGEPLGTIAITLDQDDGIVVQVSGDLVNDNDDTTHHSAYRFIRSFRQFAKDRLLNFDVQNIGKSNLDKRDYTFQAKRKEEPVMTQPVMENKLYGTNKISYQDLGEARLVIKHSQPVNLDIPAGRTMHIDSIYVENAVGERFRYPYKHINGARALAEHIKHGGIPYDSIGKYIIGLSEELSGLRKFKGYVSRQEQLSEAMSGVTSRVMERIEEVKKEIHNLQRASYYETFAEGFVEKEEQILPEALVDDLVNRLTIRTFNEELKSVFPYIAKFVNEAELPVVELSADDLLGEEVKEDAGVENYAGKSNETFAPELEFENFIDSIVSEDNDLFSPNKDAQQTAIEKLNKILEKELKGGPEGINAIQSLKGLIDDPEFLSTLKDVDSELDVRSLVQQYVQSVSPEVAVQLHFGSGSNKEQEAPQAEPVAAPPEPVAAAQAEPAPAAPEAQPAPVAEAASDDELPFEPDAKKSKPVTPGKHGQGYSKARHLARQGLANAIKKAKSAGATLDTKLDLGHGVKTIAEIIDECGMEPAMFGFEEETSPVEKMLKYVSGFYNKEEGNFPLGGQRIKIKVKKAFEDGEFGDASPEEVMQVLKLIDKKDPSGNEHNQIMRLAGVRSHEEEVDEEADTSAQIAKLNSLIAQLQSMQGQGSMADADAMFHKLKNDPNAKVSQTNTSSGTIDGKPASYDDAMNKFKQMKIKFGDDELDFSDPDKVGGQLQKTMGGMMQGMQGKVPNQNIEFPGGQMNPADMMKQIMGKINFGK